MPTKRVVRRIHLWQCKHVSTKSEHPETLVPAAMLARGLLPELMEPTEPMKLIPRKKFLGKHYMTMPRMEITLTICIVTSFTEMDFL
jgi:hypothetical protein